MLEENAKTSHGQFLVTGVRNDMIGLGLNANFYDYKYMFGKYTFADGTPFGIKE